ncbi:FHA domain protein [Collimonas arenae]|uniref:FHA domain protein n=1 Tax=Collimonas arenae TaxID=279058 RepID=A0A127QJC8_9BURK|nr:ATPase, T2SS/T4P/T4SS family [Collimonas arenae]AMP00293.1 FHA domain protein [Collimonas arenae]AMP10169.1 FHA domain protein [Collimonas arenae]
MMKTQSRFLLTVVSDDYDILDEVLIDKERFVIGKADGSDLRLKGWNISKLHATFLIDDGSVFIEDSGSIFGTWVDGERINRLGPLVNNTAVKIGNYVLTLYTDSAQESGADRAPQPAVKPEILNVPSAAKDRELEQAPLITPKDDRLADERQPSTKQQVATTEPSVSSLRSVQPKETVASADEATQSGNVSGRVIDLEFARWRKTLHNAVLHEIDLRRIDANKMSEQDLKANVKSLIKELLGSTFNVPDHIDTEILTKEVLDEAVGLGPLEPMIADEGITEIMVNRHDEIWVERGGRLELSTATFTSDIAVLGAIERIVTPLGRRIDESSPMVDARLRDGSRVNAIIPPLSLRGPTLTIRKFSRRKMVAEDLIKYGSMTADMLHILRSAVEQRLNIVVSGGTGSGKTTFLNMMSAFVPDDERIVTVEDAAELQLSQPNLVSLESRPPNVEGKGHVAIRDLVRNSLRMRPDRIIVGECRGGEALDMLQAMNTGHDGSMTTLHANSPRDALARMEVLVLMAGMNLPVRAIREQISSAVHLIIQLTRYSCGARKVTAITEVVGIESETVQLQDIFKFQRDGLDQHGKTRGEFCYSGMKPAFIERMDHE